MLITEATLGLFIVCSPLEVHVQQGFSLLVVKVVTQQVNHAPLNLPLPLTHPPDDWGGGTTVGDSER